MGAPRQKVDPTYRAYLKAVAQERKEERDFILKVERTRVRGDALMSLAQNGDPLIMHAAAGAAGAAIATTAKLARIASAKALAAENARRATVGLPALNVHPLPVLPVEVYGDGLMALAGAGQAADIVGDFIAKLRGGATSTAKGFAVPQGVGGVMPLPAADAPFLAPVRSARRR
jgi:hypothetical protein